MVWANFTIIVKKPIIWGNNFVTSVVQSKGLFIPHKAKMYIKNDDENENFKTKWRCL